MTAQSYRRPVWSVPQRKQPAWSVPLTLVATLLLFFLFGGLLIPFVESADASRRRLRKLACRCRSADCSTISTRRRLR